MSLSNGLSRRRSNSLDRSRLQSSQDSKSRRSSSVERRNPYASPDIYYGESEDAARHQFLGWSGRAVSSIVNPHLSRGFSSMKGNFPARRQSHDEPAERSKKFVVNVAQTLKDLQEREDTDNNYQITIDDHGPKVINLGTVGSAGYRRTDIRGNYVISNLLQELTLAEDYKRTNIILDLARLNENPVDRMARRIKDEFWTNLTRAIDGSVIEKVGKDPKDWTDDPRPRIYVPEGCPEQFKYYTKVAEDRPEIRLDVVLLPEGGATPEQVRDMNDKPGLLALDMDVVKDKDGNETLRGVPFIVPGGRFNELYGWDSYMGSLGLIENERVDLAKAMVRNFCFCIKHYGKILNGNRSYYLCRSQPPFLTDMAWKVYEKIRHEEAAPNFLRTAILAAIKEYYSVWMAPPRHDPNTGLSRYCPEGIGVPPETEASHFVHVIKPFAKKHDMTFEQFVAAYNDGDVVEPDLDEYFLHDRAVRESGHDTSYRLEGVAAHLVTVDLNSLLYKYETDIARIIRQFFNDRLKIPDEFKTNENRIDGIETSAVWDRRARRRRASMEKFMWSEKKGMFFDYNIVKRQRTSYESATTFWAMWAGVASPRQAAALVLNALPKFDAFGGLVSGTEASRGKISLERPNRQWDYPFGWAPQQMLAWSGLERYGYREEAQRLAYKWLYMVTKAFVDFNGIVVEKYNVTRELDPHKVEAEYGNQGSDFKGVPREGFGWVNASYVVGLSLITIHMRRALGTLTPYDTFAKAIQLKIDEEGDSELDDDDFETGDDTAMSELTTATH